MEYENLLELGIALSPAKIYDCVVSEIGNAKIIMYSQYGRFVFYVGVENDITLSEADIYGYEIDENIIAELNEMNVWEDIQNGYLAKALRREKENYPSDYWVDDINTD